MMKREKQKSTRSIVEISCVKVSEISLRLFFRIPDHSIQYTPSERMTLIEMDWLIPDMAFEIMRWVIAISDEWKRSKWQME